MRDLQTPRGICEELRYRAWQERAAATIGRTSKHRTAEAESAANALELAAKAIEQAEAFTRVDVARMIAAPYPPPDEAPKPQSSTHSPDTKQLQGSQDSEAVCGEELPFAGWGVADDVNA